MKKIEFFKVEGDRINRIRKHCPKCGPGVFLAEHKDRFGCGKCGYTEFKGGGRKEPRPPVEEKPVKQPETPEVKVEEKPATESEQTIESTDESQKPIIPESPTEESPVKDKSEPIDLEKKHGEESTETVSTVNEPKEKSEVVNEEKSTEESDVTESKKEIDKSKDSK